MNSDVTGNFITFSFSFSAITTFLLSMLLGILVLRKNVHRSENIIWSAVCFSAAIWSLSLFMVTTAQNETLALLWQYILDVTAIPIPALFFHFSCVFGYGRNFKKRWIYLAYLFALIIVILSFTPYYKLGVEPVLNFTHWIKPGKFYTIFPIYFLIYSTSSVIILYKFFRRSLGIKREQIKYMFLAGVAGFGGGVTVFFPQVIKIYPFGQYFILLYVFLVFYAITKHRLLEVRLVFKSISGYAFSLLFIVLFYLGGVYLIDSYIAGFLDLDVEVVLSIWSLFILFVFQPIRRYIDAVTDKIFFRKAVNYSEFQQRLGQEMSELIDLTQLGKMVQQELTETFHVKDVLLLVRMKNDFDHFTLVPTPKRGQRKLELAADDPFLQPFQARQDVLVTEELKRQIQDNQFKGDLEEMNRILDQLQEWSVDLVVPLRAKRELIGLLLLGEKKSGDVFTSSDIKFFQLLSPQLATAVERNKLYHQLEAHVDELIALHDFGRQMTASLDLTQTLNVIIDSVMRITGVDRALLYLLNDTKTELRAMIGRGDDPELYKNLVVPIDKTSLKYVIEQKKPLIVEDAAKDPRVNKAIAARLQTTSFIAVPLMTKDGVIGVIGVDNKKSGRSLRMVDVDVLSTLASQAATAISNDRLYEKVQNFNKNLQVRVDEATAHLKELLQMKSDFLTIASHQLRTPTSIVRGMLSMLFEDANVLSAEEKEKFISDAYEGINRLEQIINDLLNATELEGKKIRMELVDVQLEDMAADIFKELEPLAKSQKISLVYHAPAEKTLKVKADLVRLREAVKNIVANAIYYTPKGYVEMEIGKKDAQAFIRVKDTGIGITEPDKRKLFKKFSRGDGVQQIHPNGSGLGLFIAKRVVDALGGKITVESEGRDKGSVFTILLPV